MDPLSALSVAGTIVQFVDFGSKLLKEGHVFYNSKGGTLPFHQEVETITIALRSVVAKLRDTIVISEKSGPVTKFDHESNTSFDRISDGAASIAEELLAKLQTLKLDSHKHRKWESLQKAVKSVWSRQEIGDLVRRLSSFKEALNTHMLSTLCEKVDSQAIRLSEVFQKLDQQPQLIISSILEQIFSRTPKDNGSELMGSLIHLVRRLESANQDERQRTRQALLNNPSIDADDEADLVDSFELLGILPKNELSLRIKTKDTILQKLSYDNMTHRYEGIMEPYPETFEWVFHKASDEKLPWDCFVSWLRADTGIYWIGGKAGSGKSTLMKHVFEDARLREYLEIWAGHTPLCIASYFFWNSGSFEQRSQAGFLRSLLFQIFTQYPDLVPVVLPERWATSYRALKAPNFSNHTSSSWSLPQLMAAFKGILKQKRVPIMVAILVDGLDEFDGDHEELVEILRETGTVQNVKICLSSRPWVLFKDAFCACPKLLLQNLTYRDIEHYTRNRFQKSPAFLRLAAHEQDSTSTFIREVVEKADGVFLWVRLVVTSLLRGIRNRDSIEDLRERLRHIPEDFDRLYSHLLSQIGYFYLPWASKAFQVVRNAKEIEENPFLGGICPYTATKSNTGLISLTLEGFSLGMDVSFDCFNPEHIQSEFVESRCQAAELHITARCGGLLEVVPCPSHKRSICPKSSIGYLHRTARDYLEKPSHWSKITAWETSTEFSPYFILLKGCIRLLSLERIQTTCNKPPAGSIITEREVASEKLILSALVYAYHTNLQSIPAWSQAFWLAQLDSIADENGEGTSHWSEGLIGITRPESHLESFLDLATHYQLSTYVRAKLISEPETSSLKASALLHKVLHNMPGYLSPSPCLRADMISVLLECGANPNWRHNGTTAWETAVSFVYHFWGKLVTETHVEIVKIFLLAGGDPYLRLKAQPVTSRSYDPHNPSDVGVFCSHGRLITDGQNDWSESFNVLEVFNILKGKWTGPVNLIAFLVAETERLTIPQGAGPSSLKCGDVENARANVAGWVARGFTWWL